MTMKSCMTLKVTIFLLTGLAAVAHMPPAVRADERDEQNTRDRIKQRERWTEQDLDEIRRRGNTEHYAAIAYSESTGEYGYAFDYGTLGAAQRMALTRCGAADARLVGWAKNGWYCALAVGADGSYGYGSGPTAARARTVALGHCREYTADCQVVVCVYSGN
jgi:hypothetical protein